MTIKAIQTAYKGYHFRSRLEARWAVFFDALGLKWEYEPEGFELPGGVHYLPDFKVQGVWVEVKPDGAAASKARAFAAAQPGREIVVVDGIPGLQHAYVNYCYRRSSDAVFMPVESKYAPVFFDLPLPFENSVIPEGVYTEAEKRRVTMAVIAARSARFEHGESGATL